MSEFDNNNELDITRDEASESTSPDVGTASQAVSDSEPWNGSDAVSGAEIIGGAEVKKSGTKLAAIIIAIVLVLAAGCISAYAFIPQVKNKVKMLLNSPENYYAWVEENNAEKTAEDITDFIDKYDGITGGSTNGSTKIEAKLNNEAIKELMAGNDGSSNLAAVLSQLTLPESISVEGKTASLDDTFNGNASFSLNNEQLINVNTHLKDGKYYIQIPEISTSYICIDFMGMIDNAAASADDETKNILDSFKGAIGKLIDPNTKLLSNDDIEKLIVKYSGIIVKELSNAELEKNSKVTADGVDAEYTKITVKIDEGMLFSIIKNVLKEVKDDDIIGDMLDELVDGGRELAAKGIDKLLDRFGSLDIKGGKEIAEMDVYVNSKGEIKGRTFRLKNTAESDDDTTLTDNICAGYTVAENGDNIGAEFFIRQKGSESDTINISTNAVKNGDKYTGDLHISASEKKDIINTSYKDLEYDDDGYITGSMTIDLSSFGIDDISLNFDRDGETQKADLGIKYQGSDICTIEMSASRETPDKITAFNSDLPVVDIQNIEEYEASVDDASFKEVFKKLFSALGIDMAKMGVDLDNPIIWDQVKNSFFSVISSVASKTTDLSALSKLDIGSLGDLGNSDDLNVLDDPFGSIESGIGDVAEDNNTDIDSADTVEGEYIYSDCPIDKVDVKIGGKSYKVGDKIDGITDYISEVYLENSSDEVKPSEAKLKSGETAYCSKIDEKTYMTTISVTFKNETKDELPLKDCKIKHLDIYSGAKLDVKIDGFGIGDDISKLAEKLGDKITKKDGVISISDKDYTSNVDVDYTDGKISEIRINDFSTNN